MFCGHCGFENSEDSQSCAGCGKPLAKELPSSEETKKQSTEKSTVSQADDSKIVHPPYPKNDTSLMQECFEAAVARKNKVAKPYYVSQFVSFYENGTGIKSWNWSAFFFGFVWFLYRKLYGRFAIVFLFSILKAVIARSSATENMVVLFYLVFLFIYVVCVVTANNAYYKKVINRIEEGLRLYQQPSPTNEQIDEAHQKEKLISYLRDAPMVNPWAIYVVLIVWGIPFLLTWALFLNML